MSLITIGKRIFEKSPSLFSFVCCIFNKTIGMNSIRVHGKKNSMTGFNRAVLLKTKIRIYGSGNTIALGNACYLDNCKITITGNNNRILIGGKVFIRTGDFSIEDDSNEIAIGDFTTIYGVTHIAATEGKKVTIGCDCMFSSDVTIRTGDSHSIVDQNGDRINRAEDVFIGDHVWFGNKTMILKGTTIESNSVIGTGAVVTKKFEQGNIVIAGHPARIIKENIDWLRKRI